MTPAGGFTFTKVKAHASRLKEKLLGLLERTKGSTCSEITSKKEPYGSFLLCDPRPVETEPSDC